jgi:ATP-binding protein involved in chromosome partitioning
MPLTNALVIDALRAVQDPDLHKDLVTLDMVKKVDVAGDAVTIGIELTTPACPMKDKIRADIEAAVAGKARDVGAAAPRVTVDFSADVARPNERLHDRESPLPLVRHIIAVGAGKGGVGKSTVAVNLAVGLARHGARTGLLDGDIYGPSLPTMLGLDDLPVKAAAGGKRLVPFDVHGIRSMTIGKVTEPDQALIWRGPMAHGAFKQLALQTDWGELDYLIVDLPPGTGDVPLTLAQLLPLTGAVVVCTPQKVAQDDARRAIGMFRQLGVDVLGVVENMSYFVCDHGQEYDIFGRGGAEAMASAMNVPFLGAVPIRPELRANCDRGDPTANWDAGEKGGTLGAELDRVVMNLAQQVSIAAMSGRLVQPTLSVGDGR